MKLRTEAWWRKLLLLPISILRRVGRRLGVLVLALTATCGLMASTAAPAQTDTTERWTVIGRHIGDDDEPDGTLRLGTTP
ncbi:hypothetical protein [Streptomyces monomycini]|uniref:hypothetical protein n=1 Tax=Streptomyces monomycini TaxID=371720 RepID=UPI001EEBE889|nr:hypothetical protein [Streptomyces monomycini]